MFCLVWAFVMFTCLIFFCKDKSLYFTDMRFRQSVCTSKKFKMHCTNESRITPWLIYMTDKWIMCTIVSRDKIDMMLCYLRESTYSWWDNYELEHFLLNITIFISFSDLFYNWWIHRIIIHFMRHSTENHCWIC